MESFLLVSVKSVNHRQSDLIKLPSQLICFYFVLTTFTTVGYGA